jgi:phosphoribosylanthranilate isomerase
VRPVILAGGLRAENVSEAIRVARPYAVDVCSGVEAAPGVKDARALAQFMREVRDVRQSDHRP